MAHAMVKQPDGKYAIWSTVTGNFLRGRLTAEEAIQDELDHSHGSYPGGPDALRADCEEELRNIEATGRSSPVSPTWDEAIELIRASYGEQWVSDVLALAEVTSQAPQ